MQQPETSYQRANRLATAAKARKRREYVSQPKSVWVDYEEALAPVVRIVGEDRFTRWVRVYDDETVQRPTERAAFALARGEAWRDAVLVIRQEPRHERRYCFKCGGHKLPSEFDRNKHTASGLSFFCTRCRKEQEGREYRRAS